MIRDYAFYVLAAVAEIAGCFSFWAWLKMGKPAWVIAPGLISLAAFAWFLTRVESEFAGRAYAAYGSIYIVASVVWLFLVENRMPDRWDILGAAVCLIGGGIILFAPR